MSAPPKNSRSFLEQVVSPSHCFLCASEEDIDNEHVFPKWLQRKHNLSNQKIRLTNGTYIAYRDLTIPCCKKCNGTHLSKLENRISSALKKGYSACSELDSLLIYQWMAKIYYGIVRKEVTLLLDRSDAQGPNILGEDWLDELHSLHVCIQSIRRPITFDFGKPFSVLVANVHESNGIDSFNFQDSLWHLTSSLRSGGVGFITSFEDGGINRESYGAYLKHVNGRKLAPIQFDELYAKVLYQTSLINRTLKFVTSIPSDESLPITMLMMPIRGISNKPVLDEWRPEEYAWLLAHILEPWIGPNMFEDPKFFQAPNLVHTWMFKEDGELVFFKENGELI